ncbi:uncharacterized protein ACNS7B_017972 isoform 2-T3 [Menidia menidia]
MEDCLLWTCCCTETILSTCRGGEQRSQNRSFCPVGASCAKFIRAAQLGSSRSEPLCRHLEWTLPPHERDKTTSHEKNGHRWGCKGSSRPESCHDGFASHTVWLVPDFI